MPYRVEEQVTCCYAVANKFWLTDPDGHEWEFWVRTDEADSMHGETAETDAVGCCAPSSGTQSNLETNGATAGLDVGSNVADPVPALDTAPPAAQSTCCG